MQIKYGGMGRPSQKVATLHFHAPHGAIHLHLLHTPRERTPGVWIPGPMHSTASPISQDRTQLKTKSDLAQIGSELAQIGTRFESDSNLDARVCNMC